MALLAIAASAGAFFLSTGLGAVWPLAWVAPIPVLFLAFNRSARVAGWAAFAAYFLGGVGIATVFRLGGFVVFLGPPAIGFALAVLAARYARQRLPAWLATFVLPSFFTAYEFLYASISPNGTYWNIGYSQTPFLPVLQVASLAGLWGIVFCLMLAPSAIAIAWDRRSPAALTPAVSILVLAVGYGSVRVWRAQDSFMVRVGLAASDRRGATLDLAHAYADRIKRLGAEGADLAVVPEKLAAVSPEDAAAVTSIFSDAARAARITAVVGINRTGAKNHNVAMVFAPDGRVIAEYEKHHLVPILETPTFVAGDTPRLFDGPGAQWGVAICKDMDFPQWSRQYGRQGVRFLAVPALDFVRNGHMDGRVHSRMAVMRGVENGFAVARAAGSGLITTSDAYGRVLAEQSTVDAPEARLVQPVPAGPGATVYTRFGDCFGWAVVSLVAGLLMRARLSGMPSVQRTTS